MVFKASEINEKSPWQKMTPGGEIYEPGTSKLFCTGDWRTIRPVIDEDKCKNCLLCSAYCPDSSIPVVDGVRQPIDLTHCKGCGVCMNVCPFKAISMVEEGI